MAYLLGGSGYIGSAFALNLKRKEVPFRSLSRSELDYTDLSTLTAALRRDQPEFPDKRRGIHGKAQCGCLRGPQMGMPRGKRGISGIIAKACDAASVPWGHVSSGCIYTGSRLDSLGFTEEDAPNFTFRQNNCSFYTGRKRLAKKFWLVTRKSTSGAFGFPSTNSITHVTI